MPSITNNSRLNQNMFILVLSLLALAFAVIECLIGGAKLVYSEPAYIVLGLAGLSTLGLGLRQMTTVAPRRLCVLITFLLGILVCFRDFLSPVPYLARTDCFMALGIMVVYTISAVYLTSAVRRVAFVWVLLAFAVAHIGVGVVQFRDFDFMLLPWMTRPDYGFRASGFYICPNHLAGLLEMLGLTVAAICGWGRGGIVMRIVSGLATALCLAGLAITGSRGGYISIVAGLLVFAGLSGWVFRTLRPRQFFIFLLVSVVTFGLIVGGGALLMLRDQGMAERLAQIRDMGNMRVFLWQAALKQYALQPALGTGAGTYQYWGRHFRSTTLQNDPVHAHEDYLELLAEYGVAGAVLMTVFLGVHIYSGVCGIQRVIRTRLKPSGRRTSNELALIIGALAALAALLVHSLMDFNLHIPANSLVMAFLFGILANPTEAWAREEAEPAETPLWLRLSPAVLGVVLIGSTAPLIRAEYYGERARVALRDSGYPDAIDYANRAVGLDPRNPDTFYYRGEAQYLLALSEKQQSKRAALLDSSIISFQEGLKLFPQDLRLKLKLGRTLDMCGRFEEADRVLRAALEEDPNFGNVYAYYGVHMHLQHRWKKAAAFYRKAQSLREDEISVAGLKDLERDRARAREDNVLSFLGKDEDEEDDDTPTPPEQ